MVAPAGGFRVAGDANDDGTVDVPDAVATLGFLFLGKPEKLPCGDGSENDAGNIALADWQGDGRIDIADAVSTLSFLFLGGDRHRLAVPGAEESCVRIEGCSESAECR